MLIQSEASSPQDPDDHVAMHVTAGDYFLMVQDLTGSGSYQLATSFTDRDRAVAAPLRRPGLVLGRRGGPQRRQDPRHHHRRISIVNQVLVNLGIGDGTFQPPVAVPVGHRSGVRHDGRPHRQRHPGHHHRQSGLERRVDLAGQRRRHLPARDRGPGRRRPVERGGRRLQRRRARSTWPSPTRTATTSRSCWATATARSRRARPSPRARARRRWPRPTSTATAAPTSRWRRIDGSNLTIFQGNGDGTFTPVQQLATGPDCLLGDRGRLQRRRPPRPGRRPAPATTRCRIFRTRTGSSSPRPCSRPARSRIALTAADFNGDGRIDLAASNYGVGDVSIFLGHGDGTFQPQAPIPVGAVGDGHRRGRPQRRRPRRPRRPPTSSDRPSSVLLGNGDGTFQAPTQPSTSTSPPSVVAADLTGNGIEDLIVPDESTNDVSILLGRGDGTLPRADPRPGRAGALGRGGRRLQRRRHPRPGRHRIASRTPSRSCSATATARSSPRRSCRRGSSRRTSRRPTSTATATSTWSCRTSSPSTISIFYGRGDGTFDDQVVLPVGSQPGNPVVADFNGDGRPDIAVAATRATVSIFMATGPRTLRPGPEHPGGTGGEPGGGRRPQRRRHPRPRRRRHQLVQPLVRHGPAGQWRRHVPHRPDRPRRRHPVSRSPWPTSNGDGKLDIITGNIGNNDLSVLMGDGDGTFQPAIELPAGSGPYGLAVADFNGDGRPDIAVADYQSGGVTVLLNQGGGAFGPPGADPHRRDHRSRWSPPTSTTTAGSTSPSPTRLQDTVTILLGNGDGTFTTGQTISVGIDPSGLVVGDFNGDGRPDLAVADAGSNDVDGLSRPGRRDVQQPDHPAGRQVAARDRHGRLPRQRHHRHRRGRRELQRRRGADRPRRRDVPARAAVHGRGRARRAGGRGPRTATATTDLVTANRTRAT